MDIRIKNIKELSMPIIEYNNILKENNPAAQFNSCSSCGRLYNVCCICIDAQILFEKVLDDVRYVEKFNKPYPIYIFNENDVVFHKNFGRGSFLNYDYDNIDFCWICFSGKNPIKLIKEDCLKPLTKSI